MEMEDISMQHSLRNLLTSIVIISCVVTGCYRIKSDSSAFRMSAKDARRIAVLDFDEEGFLGISRLGQFAADELTSALFIHQKLKVVDRSQVLARVAERKYSQKILNPQQLDELGRALDADYFILGKITRIDGINVDPEDESQIVQVVFRILSSHTGDVIGIVQRQDTVDKDLKLVVGNLIKEMTGSVRLNS
jgi:curli biogenesis system outer membrane secretion channel CsgG